MLAHAERVSQLLTKEFSEGLRLTTIPQAMERLGVADRLPLRWQVAKRLESLWRDTLTSPETRRRIAAALGRPYDETQVERWRQQVGAWHLASIVLSENEKLAARCILLHRRKRRPLPRPAEIAAALGLPLRHVQNALRMLGRLGFLTIPDGRSPAHYRLTPSYRRFLEGLGFNFHTVSLDTGERFGVP